MMKTNSSFSFLLAFCFKMITLHVHPVKLEYLGWTNWSCQLVSCAPKKSHSTIECDFCKAIFFAKQWNNIIILTTEETLQITGIAVM